MGGLTLHNLYKSFGATPAVAGVSFDVKQGEIVAILGPSGCGKSTVLALIAGLETPDRGEVQWDGVSLAGTPPHRRGFGLMFQDFALFPHMDVAKNIAFGLRMGRSAEEGIPNRVTEVLALVGLPGFEKRDVNTLSGGEQQRVALARSLAPHPRLLMLDEPLGSLDRTLRERLVQDLGEILRRMGQTAIYVTHDQEEAFVLADRVVVMNAGRVEQIGSPQTIYRRPASTFVARFLGLNNLLPARLLLTENPPQIDTSIGRLPLPKNHPIQVNTVLLRPDEVQVNGAGSCQLEGILISTSFRGSTCRAVVRVKEVTLTFDLPSNTLLPAAGQQVRLGFDPEEALQLFP